MTLPMGKSLSFHPYRTGLRKACEALNPMVGAREAGKLAVGGYGFPPCAVWWLLTQLLVIAFLRPWCSRRDGPTSSRWLGTGALQYRPATTHSISASRP